MFNKLEFLILIVLFNNNTIRKTNRNTKIYRDLGGCSRDTY
jgi:hypothetical protein